MKTQTALFLPLLVIVFANATISEHIKITTTSPPKTTSTLIPENIENSTETDKKSNSFLNSIENYLSDEGEDEDSKKEESQNQIQGYIPQQMVPVYPSFNSGVYFYPGVKPNGVVQSNTEVESTNYFSSVLPAAQAALKAGLRLFAKVGFFIMGGAALLIIGGVFTTLVCHVTPLCTITFNGYDFKGINKETVRSLMTPEKIASAAALVQDAIGKYQRLQRAVGQ